MVVREFAPAKVNLTLHVTGQRADGYHLLDSLVVFASVGDYLSVSLSDRPRFVVEGPHTSGVPADAGNLVVQVAKAMGVSADIRLEKNLPNAAGLGGGSSDAAAALRALTHLSGGDTPDNLLAFGADVPICFMGQAARMRGIGEAIVPAPNLPTLQAVLVNPNLPVPTATVFKHLHKKENPPMPVELPRFDEPSEFIIWLNRMRNDLEAPAIQAEPGIKQVFDSLAVTPGCLMTRMSGSGGTCFGLYADVETATAAAGRLREDYPGWWVEATQLNA